METDIGMSRRGSTHAAPVPARATLRSGLGAAVAAEFVSDDLRGWGPRTAVQERAR